MKKVTDTTNDMGFNWDELNRGYNYINKPINERMTKEQFLIAWNLAHSRKPCEISMKEINIIKLK